MFNLYLIFNCLILVRCSTIFDNVDIYRFKEGEQHYNLLNQRSALPDYGRCWTNTIDSIITGCKKVTDKIQTRLSLLYLNCFLEGQKRMYYPCPPDHPIDVCTQNMTEGDRASLATFFIHTQNICYFLEIKYWNQHTERTIRKLSDTSEDIATQLEQSFKLQNDMVKKQIETVINQKEILDQTINLNGTIFSTSSNIAETLLEFQRITFEQTISTKDIFSRVAKLNNVFIEVISDIYSVVFYLFVFLLCYLSTSTPRTAKARLSLFVVIIFNFASEKLMIYYKNLPNSEGIINEINFNEIYELQWTYRKIYCLVGLCLFIHSVWSYTDVNQENYNILNEIKSELATLKKYSKRSGYESDGEESSHSTTSVNSDTTYVPSSLSQSTSSRSSLASLLDELNELKEDELHYSNLQRSQSFHACPVRTCPPLQRHFSDISPRQKCNYNLRPRNSLNAVNHREMKEIPEFSRNEKQI
ncbi:Hypothetical predicted protein [Octopus vulgaris]|uniref:Protein brambleberry-like n=1 Tax=Octopus vulgaris TaxID=6645 RepID=A0AA36ASM1_OCTVU|nr:Hypothetical predicted protein [Octopus vulgaris]